MFLIVGLSSWRIQRFFENRIVGIAFAIVTSSNLIQKSSGTFIGGEIP